MANQTRKGGGHVLVMHPESRKQISCSVVAVAVEAPRRRQACSPFSIRIVAPDVAPIAVLLSSVLPPSAVVIWLSSKHAVPKRHVTSNRVMPEDGGCAPAAEGARGPATCEKAGGLSTG